MIGFCRLPVTGTYCKIIEPFFAMRFIPKLKLRGKRATAEQIESEISALIHGHGSRPLLAVKKRIQLWTGSRDWGMAYH